MKRWILLLGAIMLSTVLQAQTVIYHENFEAPSGGDSLTSSGATNPWALNTRIYAAGAQCDSNYVQASDTSYLTSGVINCSFYANVVLKFSHICKIEVLDAGEIEISINNGPWTKLTTEYVNPGNSQFVTNGYKFNSTTYTSPDMWSWAVPTAKPQNTWWMPEQFDISALAGNQANVRIRFSLRDGTTNGANWNHGWFLDDIMVVGAPGELIPPVITMIPPVIQDTISDTGPFTVSAFIEDASGIDTAWLSYQVNGGPADHIPMIWVSDSTYTATIPSFTYGNRIDYRVYAIDNSPMANSADGPALWFYILRPPFSITIGTGTSIANNYYPFDNYYKNNRSQMLYKAAEIGMPGNISHLGFNLSHITADTSKRHLVNFTVKIKQVTFNSFGTSYEDMTTATTVFSSPSYTMTDLGWNMIDITDFTYNGTSNLVVEIVWGALPAYCASGDQYNVYRTDYSAGSDVLVVYGYDDTQIPPSYDGNSKIRPNIRFKMPEPNILYDAGVVEISSPGALEDANIPLPVTIRIKNFGQDPLVKAQVQWELDSVPQTVYYWTGSLQEAVTSPSFDIGMISVPAGLHTLKIWTAYPNDSIDQRQINDTMQMSFYTCDSILHGNYTVGPTGDFENFSEVMNSLLICGIDAPVVFNVQSGTYTEQLNLTEIPGASAINTVTFQSQSGIQSDVTLAFAATGTADNYVINLNGTDHTRFNNMTIQSTGTDNSRVLSVGNVAYDNIFIGNRFLGAITTSSTSANNAVIYSASGSADSACIFSNNIIENGSYGMYWYGGSTSILEKKTVITDNTFLNQYYRALQLYYQFAPFVSGNSVTTNSAYASFYAMYIGYCDNGLRVLKNNIQLTNGGYGLYIYYCDGASGDEGLVANNMVSIGGANTSYGLYHYYCSNQKAYYNSVNVYANSATARAYYLTGSTTTGLNHFLKDNVFAYSGTNTAGMAAYISNTVGVASSDYNDLYSTGTNLGYWGANIAALAAWRTASLKDSNSVSVNPEFLSPIDLHTYSLNLLNLGKPFPEVSDDIDGQVRSATTPDIGADEFDLLSFDLDVLAVTAPQSGCQLTAADTIKVRIRNVGASTLTNVDLYYVVNNGTPVHGVFTGTLASTATTTFTFPIPADLSAYGNYTIQVYTNSPPDMNASNDTASITIYSGYDFLSGTYIQGFEPTEYSGDWSIFNADANAYTWQFPYSGNAHSGTYSARFYNGTGNTGGDWLFSRCFPLEAGKTYEISYWYRGTSTTAASKLKLKYGLSPDSTAMVNSLESLTNILGVAYRQSVIRFVPPVTASYNFGWCAYTPASSTNHLYIDDINISFIPAQDAAVLSMTAPVAGCGLSNAEPVTIEIKNTGSSLINGNLTAYYQVNGQAPVSQVVIPSIAAGDTLAFTFTSTINMSVTTSDSTFDIKAWVVLLNDPFPANDTINNSVISGYVPMVPLVTNDTVVQNYPATLIANSADNVRWFTTSSIPTSFFTGTVYTTPALTDTVTYWVSASTGAPLFKITELVQNEGGTGATSPYPSWMTGVTASDFDGIEISNLGTVTGDLSGYQLVFYSTDATYGANGTYTFPAGTTVGSGQVAILDIKSTTGNDPSHNYYVCGLSGNPQSTSAQGYILKNPMGNIVDVVGTNSLVFAPATGVTSGDWSGNIASSSGLAGVNRSVNDNNTASDWALASSSNVQTMGALNPTLTVVTEGGCSSARVPVTAFVIYPAEDLGVIEILTPNDGCTDGLENVSIRIFNNGLDTIENSFSLGFIVSGNPTPVIETVTTDILPGDSINYNFGAPAVMNVLSGDSTYTITAFGYNAADIYFANDTISKEVTVSYTPPAPLVTGDTIIYGLTATVTAISADTVNWYADSIGGTSLGSGQTFITPVLFSDETYYAAASVGAATIKITEVTHYRTGTGQTPAYPAWCTGQDLIEISNLGSAAGNLQNYTMNIYGVGARSYTIPNVVLNAGEVMVLCVGPGTDSPANRYYNMGGSSDVIQSSSASGFALKDPGGVVVDAVASNSYSFTVGDGVSSAEWTGNISGMSGLAGSIRTISDNNVASDWIVSSSSNTQTVGSLNPGLSGAGGIGCSSERIPAFVKVIIPEEDIAMIEILSPVNGCTFGMENVTVKLKNNGIDTIQNSFTLGYFISDYPIPSVDVVTDDILPGDTLIHTFTTPISLMTISGDTTFQIMVYGENAGDIYFVNDTIVKTVTLGESPADPIVVNDTVIYGTTATLEAISPFNVNWFTVPSGGSIIDTGQYHTTPILYGNETYYVEAALGADYQWNFDTGLDGWIVSAPCTTTNNWTWNSDAGAGTLYAVDPSIASSQLVTSPVIDLSGTSTVTLSFNHRFGTEQGYDEGYVAYRFDGGSWTQFIPTIGIYNENNSVSPDPLASCTSVTRDVYAGTQSTYLTSEGVINTAGHSTLEIAFAFTSDGSGAGAGWFINEVALSGMVGCPSHRIPVTAVVTGQPDLDAGVTAILAPVSPVALGSHNVDVIIRNYGLDTLEMANVGWSVNGAIQTPFGWTGSLLTGETDTVTAGAYNFTYTPYPGLNEILVWTEAPNGGVDLTPINDTASTIIDAHDPYNGTYYIATATPDFPDFTTAALALNDWGVSGPVTVLAETGIYSEQVVFDTIPGTSATNTVTFRSLSGVNTDVTLQFAGATTAANYVLKLNNADYLHFEDMTIKSTTMSTYGRVVELSGGACSNYFVGNILQGIVSTSSSSAVVYSPAGADHYNRFIGNDILNGYYGVYFYGTSSTVRKQGNQFVDNNINGYYYYGLYTYYSDSIRIIGNQLTNATNSSTTYNIYLAYANNGARVERNKITVNATGTFYGIYAYYNNSSSTGVNTIANNFLSQRGGTGTAYGLYIYYSNYLNVYYNSVNINGGSTTAGRALYLTGGTGNVNIVNNNLANTSAGFAYYVSTVSAVANSNYNNLYTNGTVLAYWSSANRATLGDLQAISGKDVASISEVPGFYSVSDLHTYNFDLYRAGTPLAGITNDIDLEPRNVTAPCIGADEFLPPAVDAGVISIDAPVSPVSGGAQNVRVSIRNFGLDTLTTVTINYEVDGVAGTSLGWIGSLPSGAILNNVLVSSFTFPTGVSGIKAWTSLPNGVADLNALNDTAYSSVVGCTGPLAGVYTIGGAASDFLTFNEANLALKYCGVAGPVTFNVLSGSYNEQLLIRQVDGASSVNTITFQSATGVNTDVTLRYAATAAVDNFVLQLDTASYIHFKNMTLESAASGSFGKVVVLSGGASENRFENNIIRSVVSTSTTAAGIYSAAGADESYNVFTGNKIENGYYGIYFYGSSTVIKHDNEFTNNDISGYYYYGLAVSYIETVSVVGNTVRNGANSGTNYGIYVSYSDLGALIERNTVTGTNTGTFYGISLYYCDGTTADHSRVFNNFVSQSVGSGTAYGLYIYTSTYADIVYNSVNITGGSAGYGRALYQTGGSNLTILNNNLVNAGNGYAYYIGTASAVVASDYNDIYTPTTVFAYWGAARADLAALQAASGKDSNSISIDPVYISTSDLHVLSPGLNGTALPLAYVTTDYDGELRNISTPDIGADEFSPLPKDLSVISFTLPSVMYAPVGNSISVSVKIRNMGSDTVTSFDVSYKYGVNAPLTNTWTGVLAPSGIATHVFNFPFTAATGMNSLCAYTALPGDGNINNDTLCVSFTGVPILVVPDSTDFEGVSSWYGDGPASLWEFGVPASVTINAAHSPTHAWKTNIDGIYGSSQTEYLYTPYYSFTQVADATLKFWHWYETEDNYDGGKLEYNISGTTTWITLGYVGDPAGTNWYTTSVSGTPCFEGHSGGWVLSSYNLSSIPAIVNATGQVQFRFKFFSDASDNYDGWAIDDFAITAPPLAKDAGVVAVVEPAGSSVTGSNVTLKVTIKNFGTDSLMSVPVAFRVNGGAQTQSMWTGILMPGATTDYTFPTTFVSPASTYEICAFTKRVGDTYKFNDTTCVSINTTPAPNDAGVSALLSPLATTIAGDSIIVIARVRNYGTSTLTSIPLGYSRNGVQIYSFTWTGNLLGGDSVDVTFPYKYVSPMALYSLCAYSILPGDANTGNDQKCVYPEGVIGIEEYGIGGFMLWQNIPNPATGRTSIAYQVPESGKAVFELRSLYGQLLISDEQQVSAGQYTFEIDVDALSVGIYYYSVIFENKRLTKKMIVH